MDWSMILQMIMAIITVLMQFLGGGKFTSTALELEENPIIYLADSDYQCAGVVWDKPAQVVSSHFEGQASMTCTVIGLGGEGILGLRREMANQIRERYATIHAGPSVDWVGEMPAVSYDVSLAIAGDEGDLMMRGNNQLITDGFTRLSNRFVSTQIPQEQGMSYLKNIVDEVVITPNADGKFTVKMVYGLKVKKPMIVPTQEFIKTLKEKAEKSLNDRKAKVLSDMALYL